MASNAITISDYMHKPEAISRFADIVGGAKEAQRYIESVLILVENDDALKECTLKSIYISAKRAASLGLSCDKSLKQAWIIAYDVKVKAYKVKRDGKEIVIPEHWEKQAQFQPHYMGLYNLAMRTNLYRHINVSPVYEGQRVLENTLTGLHVVIEQAPSGNTIAILPDAYNVGYRDVTVRRVEKDKKRMGWIAYFKTWKGFEKSIYMSCEEIDEHAHKYVKGYEKNMNWNDAEKRVTMEMKTALRQLLSWADKTGKESENLKRAMELEDEPIEAEFLDAPDESVSKIEIHNITIEEARETIVKTRAGDAVLGDLSQPALNELYLKEETTDAEQRAIALVLKVDFQVDPPEQPKKTKETNLKELGFS